MDEDEKELLKKYRGLIPENKVIANSNVSVIHAAQENTLKAMEKAETLPKEGA